MASSMHALIFRPPGAFEKLTYVEDFPAPASKDLKPGEVLIEVAAAGVIHPEVFWPIYEAKDGTFPTRIVCPDYSGTIIAAGANVDEFTIGDQVMAVSSEIDAKTGVRKHQGGAAEFAIAPVEAVFRKPVNISLRETASIPLCAFTAWQALHEQADGKVVSGAEVLITGAGGATGLWAVQVAKYLGARVTVTASDAQAIAQLQGLGVDEVINYREQDVAEVCGRKFDVVLDAVGGKMFEQCTRVVKWGKDGGVLISIAEWEAGSRAPEDVNAKFFIWRVAKEQMAEMVKLIEGRQLKPIVDSYFPLEKGADAFMYAAKGHCHGKVVLEV